ncbi:MAG: shikimate kinase [Pyrinomonadaceae bacterium]
MSHNPIIIIGFMGSGKSTVARVLGRMLSAKVVDLDDEIVKEDGRSPGHIFAEDGESSFREIETRVLRDILQSQQAQVLALGGGAWTVERNRELITEHLGISIWLDAPFDLCWQRILRAAEVRPLARTELEARNLYTERRATYESADLHVQATMSKSAEKIALEIAQALPVGDT